MGVMKTQFMTPRDAAKALGYNVDYLRQLAKQGKIPTIRTPGGHRRYAIQEYIDTQRESGITTFATAGLVEKRRRLTSPRKSPICVKNSPKRKSSKTSAVASTSSAKDSRGYWNASCAVINSELWSPIGIDSPDSAAKSYDSWSNKTVAKSWFSTRLHSVPNRNLLPICWRFSTSFPHGCMDSVDTLTKSRKIRIYPNREQKAMLRRWEGISRYVYNEAVKHLQEHGNQVYAPDLLKTLPEWTAKCPRHIRVGAVADAQKAVTAARRKWKETGEPQRVKFRSRRNNTRSFYLCAQFIRRTGFYVRLLGDIKLAESLPAKPQGKGKKADRDHENEVKDSRVVVENGRWHMNVSYIEKTKSRDPKWRYRSTRPGRSDIHDAVLREGVWLAGPSRDKPNPEAVPAHRQPLRPRNPGPAAATPHPAEMRTEDTDTNP